MFIYDVEEANMIDRSFHYSNLKFEKEYINVNKVNVVSDVYLSDGDIREIKLEKGFGALRKEDDGSFSLYGRDEFLLTPSWGRKYSYEFFKTATLSDEVKEALVECAKFKFDNIHKMVFKIKYVCETYRKLRFESGIGIKRGEYVKDESSGVLLGKFDYKFDEKKEIDLSNHPDLSKSTLENKPYTVDLMCSEFIEERIESELKWNEIYKDDLFFKDGIDMNNKEKTFYVYKHFYIDENGNENVFYIGKGTGIVTDLNNRIYSTRRNKYWDEIVNAIKDKYEIQAMVIKYFRDLHECLNFELEQQYYYWSIGQCRGCADLHRKFSDKIENYVNKM